MRRLFLAGALIAALLVPASLASAAPYNPTGEFAKFNDCPLSRPNLALCIHATTSSGSVKTGNKTVPIVNPVILQGGVEGPFIFGPLNFFGAESGNTLSKTPQPVPGGLLGITAPSWWPSFLRNLFNETINNGFTGVTATMELAKPATDIKLSILNLVSQSGTSLEMPVKVKLSNPFLGNNCYVGSSSSPIVLKLTTGTTAPPPPNTPITGAPGTVTNNEAGTLLTLNENKQVDNAFAVPGANGCGGLFSFLIDPFVDSIVGLPSAAGNNHAILEGTISNADPNAVRASMP